MSTLSDSANAFRRVLILGIGQHPILWDPSLDQYKSMERKSDAWNLIQSQLKNLGYEYPVSDLKSTWKAIRDSFRRHQKNPDRKKDYIFAKELDFLNHFGLAQETAEESRMPVVTIDHKGDIMLSNGRRDDSFEDERTLRRHHPVRESATVSSPATRRRIDMTVASIDQSIASVVHNSTPASSSRLSQLPTGDLFRRKRAAEVDDEEEVSSRRKYGSFPTAVAEVHPGMNNGGSTSIRPDRYDAYGEYIAITLRSFPRRLGNQAIREIFRVLDNYVDYDSESAIDI